jgi:hypothetical protein
MPEAVALDYVLTSAEHQHGMVVVVVVVVEITMVILEAAQVALVVAVRVVRVVQDLFLAQMAQLTLEVVVVAPAKAQLETM